jgi:uncharacterized membrane protein YfcA
MVALRALIGFHRWAMRVLSDKNRGEWLLGSASVLGGIFGSWIAGNLSNPMFAIVMLTISYVCILPSWLKKLDRRREGKGPKGRHGGWTRWRNRRDL